MNCPLCGSQQPTGQSFCRDCGASLQQEATSLAMGFGTDIGHFASPWTAKRRALPFWGLVILIMGTGIGVVGKMLIHVDIVTVAGVLISLLGMLLTAAPFVMPSRLSRTIASRSAHEPLEPARATTKLPSLNESDFIPSVVENTTELLKEPILQPRAHGPKDHPD